MAAVSLASSVLGRIVHTERKKKALRVLVYGVEKIGKTSFAASAPGVVFLGPEDGLGMLQRPHIEPQNWREVMDAVTALERESHEYKALAIDTLDWLEPMCQTHVLETNNWKSLAAAPYGSGFTAVQDEWRRLRFQLDKLRERGMDIFLLAHAQVKNFKNPEGPDFDRYTLAMNEKAAQMWKQWPDAVLFANYKTLVDTDAKTQRSKGLGGKARVLYTQRTAAFDAGNRLGLPETLPLSWDSFFEAVNPSTEDAATRATKLCEQIRAALTELADEKTTAAVTGWLTTNAGNVKALSETLNKIQAKIQEKSE